MNLHFSASPNDKPNERFLPIDLLNDDLQLLNHSPETAALYWGRTYIKYVALPEGHTSQLSPNISRWMSQLIDSSGGKLEFRCCGSKQRQSTFSLSNGQVQCQMQQLTCFYSLAVSVKIIFSLDPLIEIFGRHTLMISILTRYSAVSFYLLPLYTAQVVLLFFCLYALSLQAIFLAQGHLCSVWGALRFCPVCHAKTSRGRTIHSGPQFGGFLKDGTISTQNSWAEIP